MTPPLARIPGISRIAYLGPAGTFTEMALRSRPEAADAEAVPFPTVDAALDAVRGGDVDAAVVAIENSVEGGVTATLDALAAGDPLVVVAEILVPITFVLAVRPGTPLTQVSGVATHSHAWAQVRGWMAANLPEATFVPALSNAAAAVDLAAGRGEGGAPYQAAVCPAIAAQANGLEIVADDIGDVSGAVTRFVMVARPGVVSPATGSDKTTLVMYQRGDKPGGLLELLEQFAVRGINLVRIESRPTGESLGEYCFSVDLEGHVAEPRVREALMGLHRVCAHVRYLGSYPRADRDGVTVAEEHGNAAYAMAASWVDGLSETL